MSREKARKRYTESASKASAPIFNDILISSHTDVQTLEAVVDFCQSMAEWKGDKISSMDGKNIYEHFFIEPKAKEQNGPIDFSPATLEKSCSTKVGMDCSSLSFTMLTLAREISL